MRAHPSLANSQQAEKRSVQATQIFSISHSKVGCVFLVDKTLERKLSNYRFKLCQGGPMIEALSMNLEKSQNRKLCKRHFWQKNPSKVTKNGIFNKLRI